jgi:DNA topoisomerase-1
MEEDLDKISKGHKVWHELCKECNDITDFLIKNIHLDTKLEIKIDDIHSYIIGKNGPVIKCSEMVDGTSNVTFKQVKKDIDIQKLENNEYTLEEIVDKNEKKTQYILGKHENENVILRKSKFGLYIMWGEKTQSLKHLGNRPIESITFKDVEQYLGENSNIIRHVSDNITIRKSNKGDYVFFKSVKMKKPAFYTLSEFKEDYKTCEISNLKSWITETHNIF